MTVRSNNEGNADPSKFSMGQHIPNDETLEIETIDFYARERSTQTDGTVTVSVIQDGSVVGSMQLDVSDLDLSRRNNHAITATFATPVVVEDDYSVLITYEGDDGRISLKTKSDRRGSIPGNLFVDDREIERHDFVVVINNPRGDNLPRGDENNNDGGGLPGTGSTIFVLSKSSEDKSNIDGMYVEIRKDSRVVKSGFTSSASPFSYNAEKGKQYLIGVSDFRRQSLRNGQIADPP